MSAHESGMARNNRIRRIGALAALAILAPSFGYAQIYSCVAEDGTRVFSDERCGPDAKVVPGINAAKRAKPQAPSAGKPRPPPKSPAELEALSASCDAGDVKACKAWTMGGGPNLLRDRERRAEMECEGGVLAACEQRYCRQHMDEDCRARILRTARLAGENWYLRAEEHDADQALVRYALRCLTPPQAPLRDVLVSCRNMPGPKRCFVGESAQGDELDRLDRLAERSCR